MKVFFLSLPFDIENSGDYDYCHVSATALKNLGIDAQYVTGRDISGYNSQAARSLITRVSGHERNVGGEAFYNLLRGFYEDQTRIELANIVKTYLESQKLDGEQAVLNLQIRAPETGFLFSPYDLEDFHKLGFKVCITCHEYKLNYNRKWLQSILHPYFEHADLVFFFNEKDMSNAAKHANRSVFLDDLLSNPGRQNYDTLLHGFSSRSHSTFISLPYDQPIVDDEKEADRSRNLIVTKQKITQLKCEVLVGELGGTIGPAIRYSESGHKTKVTPPFTLEWGIRENFEISSNPSNPLSVSGVIINPVPTAEIRSLTTKSSGKFVFDHRPYDLISKSQLTRVPPTTANIDEYNSKFDGYNTKPANIIIFGLIREAKGFEDAIEIIKKVYYEYKEILPNTRLIIVGKPDSLKLLAEIINKKFNCPKVITEDLLSAIFNSNYENLPKILGEAIKTVLDYKLKIIKDALTKNGVYSYRIEHQVLEGLIKEKQENHLASSVKIINPSKLQIFVSELGNSIPEFLPIDIFLDILPQDLPQIFAQAKYAIKYDEKGWANNASGLINLLCYGCILYTSWGMCTDKEVTDGRYIGAIVLPKNKYCLKQGEHLTPEEEGEGKRECFTTERKKIHEKKNLITPQIILDDIVARETNVESSSDALITGSNSATLEQARLLLNENFHPIGIAQHMIESLSKLFCANNPSEILRDTGIDYNSIEPYMLEGYGVTVTGNSDF